MKINILTLVILCTLTCCVSSRNYACSEKSALNLLKHPSYIFTLRILRRVAEDTDGHFVFSPLSTWMQLIALAEQTQGKAFREIYRVTRHSRNRCYQRKLLRIFNKLDRDLSSESKRINLMVVDQYMNVKPRFKRQVEKLYGIKLMVVDFDDPEYTVEQVNRAVGESTGSVIDEILYYDDFFLTVLLISDASSFTNEWKIPFDAAVTTIQPFYTSDPSRKVPGRVSMMNQIGNFNLIDFPELKYTVLELPCANSRVSMLVFLPYPAVWPGNLFYDLQNMTMATIFNKLQEHEPKLVNVSLPRFRIQSEIDNIPELVMDMGVKKIFYPNSAELKGISSFPQMHVSLMTQISFIEVTEKGLDVGTIPYPLGIKSDSVDFIANRPFSYMIVDKQTQFILYAGTYSAPSVI